MHAHVSGAPRVAYRERLSPSLWAIACAAVAAPMIALVFVPLDPTVGLIAGTVVAALLMWLMVAASPTVTVDDAQLRVGRAQIEPQWLGEPEILTGDAARHARGPGLDPRAWHLVRGGIDGVVRVPILDPDDPVPYWVFSSRTPERTAAAIRRAQDAAG